MSPSCLRFLMPHRRLDISNPAGLWPLTWPMGLTLLRLLLLPVFLWLILAEPGTEPGPRPLRWWAIALFGLMALTDKLDGCLARKLKQVSRLGTVLDPLADKLLVASSVVLLSFDWVATRMYQLPMAVVLAIYGGYLAVAIGTVALLAVVGTVSITPRPLGKLNTVLQLALVMLTLVAPELHGRTSWIYPTLKAMWWIVPIVAIMTAADYVVLGFRHYFNRRTS
jgi:CDP-diacylglycerol--glycerol-3-phosphate 3-phosphatidyltransferase